MKKNDIITSEDGRILKCIDIQINGPVFEVLEKMPEEKKNTRKKKIEEKPEATAEPEITEDITGTDEEAEKPEE